MKLRVLGNRLHKRTPPTKLHPPLDLIAVSKEQDLILNPVRIVNI